MSKAMICGGFALAAWLAVPPALAEPAFEIGGRLGYAFPFGNIAEDDDLAESVSGMIPIWLDLGVRVDPLVSFGAFGSFGHGVIASEAAQACEDAEQGEAITDCSMKAWDVRLGAALALHFGSDPKAASPWIGIGMGYEWLSLSLELEGIENGQRVDAKLTGTARGLEFVNLHAGLDFPISPRAWLGPFVTYTVGRFDHGSSSCDGECGSLQARSEEIEEKAIHSWLFAGARVVVLP